MQEEEFEESYIILSSPTSAVSSEETRILTEYITRKTCLRISKQDETLRKSSYVETVF